jgi:hypothetical protein
MIHAFVDERYDFTTDPLFIAVACIAVPQSRYSSWHRSANTLRPERTRRFLRVLEGMLLRLDGFAVVAAGTIESSILRVGDTDATLDVPRMARTDNAGAT